MAINSIKASSSTTSSALLRLAARSIIVLHAVIPEMASAECLGLVKGPISVDVQSCGMVKPEAFDLTKQNFRFIKDLDAAGRTAFYNQYRGLAIKGVIVRSQAIREGFNPMKGALQGENQLLFIPPGSEQQCAALVNKRVTAMLQEKCCDGNGDAPCLLGTGFAISRVQIGGEALLNGDGKSITPGRSADKHGEIYKEAEKLYGQKKYKEAVVAYKKAEADNDIDIKGLYRLGFSHRELENCPAAIAPLKKIYDFQQNGKVWAEQELDSRRGIFLLARCHAKMGEASSAVFYLNGFLLEPKKYRAELTQALKHKDFGWIHTSKEYTEFRAEAVKKLGTK